MSKHTPGPWTVEKEGVRRWIDSKGRQITSNDEYFGEEDLANLSLIAAAPDLLAALKDVLTTGYNGGNNIRLITVGISGKACKQEDLDRAEKSEAAVISARAAIAKAEGGAS